MAPAIQERIWDRCRADVGVVVDRFNTLTSPEEGKPRRVVKDYRYAIGVPYETTNEEGNTVKRTQLSDGCEFEMVPEEYQYASEAHKFGKVILDQLAPPRTATPGVSKSGGKTKNQEILEKLMALEKELEIE